jgi:peptide/nickel transport system substrate-binding protein
VMTRVLAAAFTSILLATAAGAATPTRGGTVVVGRHPLVCLNPFGPCNLASVDPVLTQVLEGAFEVGPDLVFRPNLVSKVTIGRNPFTLTYHIRQKARWSDGAPVTAADFRFTYRTFAGYTAPVDGPDLRDLYAKIRRVRVLGAKTFRVELREPTHDWRSFFALVLPQHALAGENITAMWRDRIDNPKTGRPIGNGPFLVSRFEPGKQLILVRNPNYWGTHRAYLNRVVFDLGGLDPADPLGRLRRNELHVTSALDAAQASEAARIPGWRVASWPALTQEILVFRKGPGGHLALRNKLVRQALAYGIDRTAIARAVNAELGNRARPLDSDVLLPGEPSYRPNWSRYRYNPARSRELLERAGCRRGGDTIYSCAGERLRLRFITTVGDTAREQALRLMQTQLLQAGVDVQPTFAPRRALFNTILPGGNFDAALFSWTRPAGGNVTPEARCFNVQNWAGYCSRLTMRDVQQTDRILDPVLRARVLNDVDEKLARDVPVLPLFQGLERVAVRDTVRGFVAGGSALNSSENSEDWWLAR